MRRIAADRIQISEVAAPIKGTNPSGFLAISRITMRGSPESATSWKNMANAKTNEYLPNSTTDTECAMVNTIAR
jgi:hypothetical protein